MRPAIAWAVLLVGACTAGLADAEPNQVKLVCHMELRMDSDPPQVKDLNVVVDYGSSTANGEPAVISEGEIHWTHRGPSGAIGDLSINRYTGQLVFSIKGNPYTATGPCSVVAAPRF